MAYLDLAYLDAGSGSLIVQAVIAGAAGVAVAVKMGWHRITGLFRRRPAGEEPAESSPAESAAAELPSAESKAAR